MEGNFLTLRRGSVQYFRCQRKFCVSVGLGSEIAVVVTAWLRRWLPLGNVCAVSSVDNTTRLACYSSVRGKGRLGLT